jgi:hypothetical protein
MIRNPPRQELANAVVGRIEIHPGDGHARFTSTPRGSDGRFGIVAVEMKNLALDDLLQVNFCGTYSGSFIVMPENCALT